MDEVNKREVNRTMWNSDEVSKNESSSDDIEWWSNWMISKTSVSSVKRNNSSRKRITLNKEYNIIPILSLKLQRRVKQESYESEVPVGGGAANVGVSVHPPRRVIIVVINSGVPVGEARTAISDLSASCLVGQRH